MLDLLRQACFDGGRLRGVREELLALDSPLVAVIELQFEALTINISAVTEDDTVLIALGPLAETTLTAGGVFWPHCIGKPLQWAWLMTNHQGYADGVRLEFNDPDERASVHMDLIVSASSIHSYQARPVVA